MRFIVVAIGLLVSLATPAARAADEVLSLRVGTAGYEAVITGLRDNECAYLVNDQALVSVQGSAVSIVTPAIVPPPCFLPIVPPQPYSVVVTIGSLPAGQYTVTWRQDALIDLSAPLSVPAAPQVIPASGAGTTALLTWLLAGIGALFLRRR